MQAVIIYLIVTLPLLIISLLILKELVVREYYRPFFIEIERLEKQPMNGRVLEGNAIIPSEIKEGEEQEELIKKIGEKVKKRRYKKNVRTWKKRLKITVKKQEKKKVGKPKGARGGGRKRPTRIDRREVMAYKKCPVCGKSFAGKNPRVSYTRVVTDMVFHEKGLHVENTEYRVKGYKCNNCNTVRTPSLKLRKGGRFGYGMMTYVIMKKIEQRLSYNLIVLDLERFFHESITKTTLINWMKESVKPVEKVYKKLWKRAVKSNYLHVDETGLPMNGENWWMWVLVTKNIVLFHVNKSRGHDAIKKELEEFQGVIISDFWSAYNKLDKEQQKCWAHLIRKLEEILWDKQRLKEELLNKLKLDEEREQDLEAQKDPLQKKRGRKKTFPEALSTREIKKIKSQISQLNDATWQCLLLLQFFTFLLHEYKESRKEHLDSASQGKSSLPPADEAERQLEHLMFLIEKMGAEDPDVLRILKRLKKFKTSLFTFLKHDDVLPDNNPVERAIRPFVVLRNNSHDFKSEEGANAHAIHLSLQETCKRNDIDYKSAVTSCLHENWDEVLVQIPDP